MAKPDPYKGVDTRLGDDKSDAGMHGVVGDRMVGRQSQLKRGDLQVVETMLEKSEPS